MDANKPFRGILRALALVAVASLGNAPDAICQELGLNNVEVLVRPTLDSLIAKEDTDQDKRITIDDPHIPGTDRGNRRFWFDGLDGKKYEVDETYYLSNLLQDLKLAEDEGKDTATLSGAEIFGPPVQHIAQSIKDLYWAGLTRKIDEAGLEKTFTDEKVKTIDGFNYVYVPHGDTMGYDYFSEVARGQPDFKMKVVMLPTKVTPQYVNSLNDRPGVLSLRLHREADGKIAAAPFVVPGGRFNEMYGWDSYFITLGLLQDGKVALAKSMVDNFIYEIDNYGKILNANRTYYLTRSQPPFFTSMALAVYNELPKNEETRAWLKQVLEAAIKQYSNYWMGPAHMTKTGLSRYYDNGTGPPPEVEPHRYHNLYAKYAKNCGMDEEKFRNEYLSGKLKVPVLDTFFKNDRAMRESGNDASYRLQYDCIDLVTVDLNSLLYKEETNIANIIGDDFGGEVRLSNGKVERSLTWYKKAERRKKLMTKYLWNVEDGMFFDYNFATGKQTGYVAATAFYPLWAKLATKKQAEELVKNALPLLDMPGGIVGSTEKSRGPIKKDRPQTQWDYPFGWSPQQMLTWVGLKNYGYAKLARELAYKWLYTITVNAYNYNGTIAEKYDVMDRSSQVFAEYGNVGTQFSYVTRQGFGWTNASYVVGLTFLTKKLIADLDRLVPPEWVFRK
ncbi:MAG: alpha,alpha-trehalase [Bacteroidetes bacterium]|nr:alpha,alpha-trehalase [Bacteroidota bacterium]